MMTPELAKGLALIFPAAAGQGTGVACVAGVAAHVAPPLAPDADAIEERAALGADCVPASYLDAWARLNHRKPAHVSEVEWTLALDDGGHFLDMWGDRAEQLRWTAGELFDAPGDGGTAGLIWKLKGTRIVELCAGFARTNREECFRREP
jgi:hypothetical protein